MVTDANKGQTHKTMGYIVFLFVMNLFFSCSDIKKTNTKTKPGDSININGTVTAVNFGKDGYTADVQTEGEGTFIAMVSIPNLGGRQNYKTCDVGDKISLKGTPYNINDAKYLRVTEIMSIVPGKAETQLLISPISFRGIQIGDLIADHKEYTAKTKLKTGEGTFDVYEIKDFENNPAGYFLPDPKNKLLVGDIVVQSPKAATAKGINVGDSFQDLLAAFPNIAVHGSEIESRTTATAHNISYRLDIANNQYNVDKTKIPAATKITEITINRGEIAKAMILENRYNKISEDLCWQSNKTLVLYAEPNAKSKAEGKHFAGETLKVLESKMIDDRLWVKVTYTLSVKAGYEDNFADGRVTPSGSPTGWIGGTEIPEINCK
jgi:hypothetical protein